MGLFAPFPHRLLINKSSGDGNAELNKELLGPLEKFGIVSFSQGDQAIMKKFTQELVLLPTRFDPGLASVKVPFEDLGNFFSTSLCFVVHLMHASKAIIGFLQHNLCNNQSLLSYNFNFNSGLQNGLRVQLLFLRLLGTVLQGLDSISLNFILIPNDSLIL